MARARGGFDFLIKEKGKDGRKKSETEESAFKEEAKVLILDNLPGRAEFGVVLIKNNASRAETGTKEVVGGVFSPRFKGFVRKRKADIGGVGDIAMKTRSWRDGLGRWC